VCVCRVCVGRVLCRECIVCRECAVCVRAFSVCGVWRVACLTKQLLFAKFTAKLKTFRAKFCRTHDLHSDYRAVFLQEKFLGFHRH
jgi:hypothetical protein